MYVTLQNNLNIPESGISVPKPFMPRRNRIFDRTIQAGQMLFREGDEAFSVFEVLSGVVRMSRVMQDGRRQVIAFGYPGDVIGFPAEGRHHSDCDVISTGRIIVHKIDALKSSETNPALHDRLLDAALREISQMQDHFLMLGRKSAPEKIASFLLVLMERVGRPVGNYTQIDLPMTRSDIADFLGLTTETVSRTITHFRNLGVVELENPRSMVILKPEELSDLSHRN